MMRVFQQADLDQCVDLFISTFARPPWSETWDRSIVSARLDQITQTPMSLGVVIGTDKITGFALGFSEPWHEGTHFYLKEMCIHHEHQREGLGTRLMEFLFTELGGRDTKRVYLLTARGDASEAFYSKVGFYTSPKMILMARRIDDNCGPSVNPNLLSTPT